MTTVTCEGTRSSSQAVLTETWAGRTHQIASKTRTDIAVNIKEVQKPKRKRNKKILICM